MIPFTVLLRSGDHSTDKCAGTLVFKLTQMPVFDA